MKKNCIACFALAVGLFCLASVRAQTVSKLADLTAGQDQFGNGYGPSTPECRFTPVGTNLWFTSYNGGAAGAGGVFIFDPFTSNVTQVATLNNTTGTKPQGAAIAIANGLGWFTTSAGGTGAKGSLCSIDLTNYTVSTVYSFPTNDYITSFNGQSPHCTPVQIGQELWFTCFGGGTNSVLGTVTKYNLTNKIVTDVFRLTGTNGPNYGRQPYASSLVPAGANTYYFMTFAGGTNVSSFYPNGAGVLNKITFDASGNPALTKVADMGGYLGFPSGDPVYDGTNFLYFAAVGANATPGGIGRYDISNNILTSLFNFVSNAPAVTNFGKQLYCTPVLYNNELFFTTLSGGTLGKGVLGMLSLSNNAVTKLADFEGTTNLALGASPMYNSGTVFTNPADGRIGVYFPINVGGANNLGTIVRVNLPPPPILAALANNGDGTMQLSWTGGYSPFSVDAQFSSLGGSWTTNLFGALNTNSVSIPATNDGAFFRVSGASQ